MSIARILFVLLLAGCEIGVPSPSDCRWAGVNVQNEDTVTGKLMHEYHAGEDGVTPVLVQQKCNGAPNCFRAVGFRNLVTITPKGEYEIWVSQPTMLTHERCHALYEEQQHTD